MVKLEKTWEEIKDIYNERKIPFQFEEYDESYTIYGADCAVAFICEIDRDGVEEVEFETYYKNKFNKPIEERNGDGRQLVVSTSRPRQATTYFTCAGDDMDNNVIGEGHEFYYDFDNNDDSITAPAGYKRKQIDFQFIDSTWIKEGTIYFHNAIKRSYVDLFVVCPAGQYYLKNDGSVGIAEDDLPIQHFVNKLFVQGDCPMGDELNTESASDEIPSDYKYRMWITVPDTDVVSNGYINLEIYRERTCVL